MASQNQPGESIFPTDKDPYSDELVGLHKYRVGGSGKYADSIEFLRATNFWIVTYDKMPRYDEDANFDSGKGYTTELSVAKWVLEHKEWPTKGYAIKASTPLEALTELKIILHKLNTYSHWFGTYWPNTGLSHWCPHGNSLNCRYLHCDLLSRKIVMRRADDIAVRKQWVIFNQGRYPITAGEPIVSTTIQEDQAKTVEEQIKMMAKARVRTQEWVFNIIETTVRGEMERPTEVDTEYAEEYSKSVA